MFSGFLTVPSPSVLIVTMEERHVYMCNHSETVNIFWRVNGSRLSFEIFPIKIDTSTLPLPGNNRVYTLEIGGRLEHNATTIQCSARLSDGSIVTTPSVSFLMQGIILLWHDSLILSSIYSRYMYIYMLPIIRILLICDFTLRNPLLFL